MAFALVSRSRSKPQGSVRPALNRKFARGQHAVDSQFGFAKPVVHPSTTALPTASVIQTKHKVREADDQFEEEGDGVADEVTRIPNRTVSGVAGSDFRAHDSTPNRSVLQSIQRMCAECAEDEKLQRMPLSSRPVPPHISVLNSPLATQFQLPIHTVLHQPIQAKLTVGRAGDSYEQEADRVATAIMRMPEPQALPDHLPTLAQDTPTRPNWLQGKNEVRRQPGDFMFEVPEGEELLQTKTISGQTSELPPRLETELNGIEGKGQLLPTSIRAFFEPRFNCDLSPVRVHTDTWAHQAARAVHARAFTIGRNIVFGAGQYAPTTSEGQYLMAHELTHTLQQGAVLPRPSPTHQPSTRHLRGFNVPPPPVRPVSKTLSMLQKADCNFYVFDSTEPTNLGTVWEWAARGLATKAHGGYAIASGDRIEEMLYRVLSVYAEEDCDCIEEIQFLSHGSSGNAMYISKTGEELTIHDFNIPDLNKFGDGPRNTAAYRAWYDKLTPRQRRLVLLRRILCGPGAEVYYRSCEAFQGKKGQEFAQASATFWRAKVIGHTKVIGLTQPGQKVLKPGQEPYWSESEGVGGTNPKKPRKPATVKPKKD